VASLPGNEQKSYLNKQQRKSTLVYNGKKPANCDLEVVVEHTMQYCTIDSSFGKQVTSIMQHAAKRCAEAEEPLGPLSEVEKLVWSKYLKMKPPLKARAGGLGQHSGKKKKRKQNSKKRQIPVTPDTRFIIGYKEKEEWRIITEAIEENKATGMAADAEIEV